MLTQTLKSYPYQQYADDADISAFFDAYNALSQANLDEINALELPIFLNQSGQLLDWCGLGIYGVPRNNLPAGGPIPIGPLNTWALNTEVLDSFKLDPNRITYQVTDLVYQRIIQWNTFKGDGKHFTINWLKRRVCRFLSGELFPDQTYQISVYFESSTSVVIGVYAGSIPLDLVEVLNAAIAAGACGTPFQYQFRVIEL
jgi:hypothetical protein